jgi:monothiol glutaredoxin
MTSLLRNSMTPDLRRCAVMSPQATSSSAEREVIKARQRRSHAQATYNSDSFSQPSATQGGALCTRYFSMSNDVQTFIDKTVKENPVVLFMKGTAQFPQCGFSGRAIQLLKQAGAQGIVTVNVLEDEEVCQGIKTYSNWPTIPQLYVKGEFVGGSDIMAEMFASGELQKLLTS